MRSANQLKNLKKFKKGQSGNPEGGRAHNKEIKAVKALTQKEVAEVASLIIGNNLEALKAIRNNPASSVLKVWICSVAITAINKGDAHALDALLNRVVGKVKEESTVTVHTGPKTVPDMTVEEASERMKLAQTKC